MSSFPRVFGGLVLLFLLAAAAMPARADCTWPGPDEEEVDAFLNAFCYREWEHDNAIRDTGPYIHANSGAAENLDYGVHPASRIYYSPTVAAWVKAGRPDGGPPAPAMIVKEMYTPPAMLYAGLDDETLKSKMAYWTVMLDAPEVADGWYWMFGYNKSFEGYAPAAPCEGSAFECRVTEQLAYPDAGLGSYCTRCHASAEGGTQTFSTIANFGPDPEPVTFLVVPPRLEPDADVLARFLGDGGTHADITATPPVRNEALPMPLPAPDPAFLKTFPQIAAVPRAEVEATAFPPETFDHAVMPSKANPHTEFITSDQCIGCHDATVGSQWNPPMLLEDVVSKRPANLSPYGEWRYSMMGLAGRDPIFFAQLESERATHAPIQDWTQNLCLSCHGAMGQRQFQADTAGDQLSLQCGFTDTDPDKCFTRDRLKAFSTVLDENSVRPTRYGALGREGISCTVCHHMSGEGLGTKGRMTGRFKLGPSDALYGPYKDVLTKPMEYGLNIRPEHAQHVTESKMCGACHAIFLPVFDAGTPVDKNGDPVTDPKDQLVHVEQATYLEWTNSVYQDERDPVNHAQVRSCQSCHMPTSFQGTELEFAIAAIEDDLYPFTHNRLPDADIAVRPRKPFSRHMLAGINGYGLQFFAQFPLILGIRTTDPMVPATTQPGLITSINESNRLAKRETARLDLVDVTADAAGVAAVVQVTNKAGHKFPSGVGFRRAFLNVELQAADGTVLWASGGSNDIGVILDGDGAPLVTEFYGPDQQEWEPDHAEITRQDQVQIYELVERDPKFRITTSFIALFQTAKDNRLLPRGWRRDGPWAEETTPCTWVADAAKPGGGSCVFLDEAGYNDGGGFDRVTYRIGCDAGAGRGARLVARVYYQAIPPHYLNERFNTAQGEDTRRLYYLASHLNTKDTPVEGWKLLVAETAAPIPAGAACGG